MDKKQKKQFDLNVIRILHERGIFNQMNADTLTDIAIAVQSSKFDSMKYYKNVKNDIDNVIAQQIVFEYLKRNNALATIRCIQIETQNRMRPKSIPEEVKTQLQIPEKTNVIHEVLGKFMADPDTIVSQNQDNLRKEIIDRYKNLGKKKPAPAATSSVPPPSQAAAPPKSKESKSKAPTPKTPEQLSQASEFDDFDEPSPPKAASKPPKAPPSPKKQAEPIESSSQDFDMNFDDDDMAPKSASKKTTTTTATAAAAAKTAAPSKGGGKSKPKSESSEPDLDFDDEQPDSLKMPSKIVPKANPSKFESSSEIELELSDDIPKKKEVAKKIPTKNDLSDDDFDFDEEPPMMGNNTKTAVKPGTVQNAESSGFDDDIDLSLG